MSRRGFLQLSGVLAGAGAVSPLIAACSSGSGSSSANATAVKSPNKSPLHVLGQAGSGEQPVLQDGARAYTQSSGVAVSIDPVAWTSLLQKAEADFKASPPTYDVFWSDLEFAYTFWPHLEPLNSYITANKYDMSGFFPSVTSNGLGIGPDKTTRYGLPIAVDTQVLWYRSDKIPADQFPRTWSGYDDVLKEFTGGGKYALSVAGEQDQQVGRFLSRYWGIPGTKLFDSDYKPLINGDEGVAALTMYRDQALKYAPPGFQGWAYADALNAWMNGDTVIHEGWPEVALPTLQDPTKNKVIGSNWGVAAYPEGGAAQLTQHNLLIFKTSKNPGAAFDYIASQTNVARAAEIIQKYHVDSARQSEWEALLPTDATLRQFYPGWKQAMKAARPFARPLPQWFNMLLSIGTNIQNCLAGKATPKQALDQTASEWSAMIAQGKPSTPYEEVAGA